VIAGRYAVQRLIGKGGMAVVVAARHLELGGQVALKILDPKIAADEAGTERFFREARAITTIKSEHVVRVLDVGRSEAGLPFFVMELLVGQDLGQLLASGPLPFHYAVDFVLQASEALAEAHAAGIVHRDLKPSNLFLCQRPDGTPLVKVLDFGISKVTQSENVSSAKLTETQSIFGSPMYMSPEQIRSAKKVDHRTDVWAIGVVLFELLTGHLPFDAENAASALASITADAPKLLRAFRPDAPPGLEAAILHCLEKDVTRRCQSLAELARLLAPFASPIGHLSAARIERLGAPHAAFVPMAAASSGRSLGAERPTVTAFTHHGSAMPSASSRSPALGIVLGVGLAVTILGAVFAVRAVGSRGTVTPASASPSSGAVVVTGSAVAPLAKSVAIVPDASVPAPVASTVVTSLTGGASSAPVPSAAASVAPTAKPVPKGGPKYTNVRK
jgi:serine/threonine-protein kinase